MLLSLPFPSKPQARKLSFLGNLFGPSDALKNEVAAVDKKLQQHKSGMFGLRREIAAAQDNLKDSLTGLAQRLQSLNSKTSKDTYQLTRAITDLNINFAGR